MKWFKHYSDNYRGRSVASFNKKFGHTGIAWYYLLTEICAEKLEKPVSGDLTKDQCRFSFDRAFVESSLRGTFVKIERWLSHGQVMGLWSYTVTESEIHVDYPILLELLDSDSRKSRSRRDKDANSSRLEEEKERDKEEDKIKKKKVPDDVKLTNLAKDGRSKIKQAYINAYRLRYSVDPSTNNAAFNSQVMALQKKLGTEESCAVVEFFLNHPKGYYVENTHAFWIIPKDAETLRTQMLRGKPVTKTMVREFEKKVGAVEYQDQISNMFKEENE